MSKVVNEAKIKNPLMMHPVIKAYIGTVLGALACGTEKERYGCRRGGRKLSRQRKTRNRKGRPLRKGSSFVACKNVNDQG